uniref:2-(3-amino-3-carboxypropyl)histidine synthase subunit 1 n=1 Tax=Heterorhabditis bacteriophora TaxID=37862 RepID=A0A1I7XTB8_HETBA
MSYLEFLGCDLLVHYGHSCLVPIQYTENIHMLYVFVNIDINLTHFIDCLKSNFMPGRKIALVSTIQFIPSLQSVRKCLSDSGLVLELPQCRPLSPGEVLGCTSPRLNEDVNSIIYLGDGRFHLESVMIHNPNIPAYQYDPYSRKLTREFYDFDLMRKNRLESVEIARKSKTFGLIQGTLGRQGNIKIVENLEKKLDSKGKKYMRILLSEIFPDKLDMINQVDCWVQVACPRLSIDWGTQFRKPLLSPYELAIALDAVSAPTSFYPMDFYSNDSLGPWTNNHKDNLPKREKRRPKVVVTCDS